jgi:8-oxo-dGTP pyrophosphatase MutT (NUDIX family)
MGFEGSALWQVRQKVGTGLILWPGATVMVQRDDGRVLLGLRGDNGVWAMPGGGAEFGSSFADTALTELREETGLLADEDDLEAFASVSEVGNHLVTYPNGDRSHYFGLWFLLRRWRGEPVPDGEEMLELDWFDPGDPPRPLLGSTDAGLALYGRWIETGRFQAR